MTTIKNIQSRSCVVEAIDITFILTISEMSETCVPPQGQPGKFPNFTMRGVLPCKRCKTCYNKNLMNNANLK